MIDAKRVNGTAGRLAEEAKGAYGLVLDHFVGLQERNVRFAQGFVEESAREVREQAELNRELVEELVRRAEGQRDLFQRLLEDSVRSYMDLLYAPLAYYRQGLRLVEGAVEGSDGLPIEDYDELNVAEISRRIEGLGAAEIRQLREHERRNKNRETLIDLFDRKLRATSA
ncbi:hypothetical protein RxyAA322_20470 [Rubrobacter xylanophilus]|uniref:Uncharacterized protein n=1 Tax=Rubrobacter xylanophilus TaxID=49319 RepID=A0A510HND4_9ACTN|nr:hypothetical protein [Rubrobacter xylanophilus]BBL80193.1 hypothetical protein RxyAA322_20470 [Rubrobacter xylanophilus]